MINRDIREEQKSKSSPKKMKKDSAMKMVKPSDRPKPTGKKRPTERNPKPPTRRPELGDFNANSKKTKRPTGMLKDRDKSAMKMKKMEEGAVKKTKKDIRKENRADRKKSRDYKKYSQLNPKNPDRD
jgi:LAS superfamily LD-carboxypeptidase LdcB